MDVNEIHQCDRHGSCDDHFKTVMSGRIRFIVCLIAFVLCTGCATIRGELPPTEPYIASDTFRAGAAQNDITPPPGFAMGGHSIAGEVSRGHWLRLYAKSIFMESTDGRKLAFVSADLWAIPAGLGDRVAEILGSTPSMCHIRRDQLILAATHTHQSPGNYSSSFLYNSLASKKIGFDPDLFQFLAERISTTIRESCERAQPALLRFSGSRIEHIARNRSIESFLVNDEAQQILSENAGLGGGCTNDVTPDPRACGAIFPVLRTLQLSDRYSGDLIGVAAFVAVHPTTMSHSLPVYSSDFFGIAANYAERRLRKSSTAVKPIVAIFNGEEGDVSPIWFVQNRDDAIRLGRLLGEEIVALQERATTIKSDIRHHFDVRPLANRCIGDDKQHDSCTFKHPAGGAAALGGAEDGRTFLYKWGCREGESPSLLCGIAYAITHTAMVFLSGPTDVPVGIYRIGPIAFVTLPGEFTTVMGRRIREGVGKILAPEISDVILIGLANEYVSYFASPQEYNAQPQQYEGASTLYGPASAPLIMQYAEELATKLKSGEPDIPRTGTFSYAAGIRRTFSPSDLPNLSPERLDKTLRTVTLGGTLASAWQHYCWRASAPTLAQVFMPRPERWRPTPSVHIEIQESKEKWGPLTIDGIPEDDQGINIVTALAEWKDSDSSWCAFWLPPINQSITDNLRFVVETQDGAKCISSKFQINDFHEQQRNLQKCNEAGVGGTR
ncbi:MAG: neutral/alkaline non-lysosomal ceramidase N-terminal domain-containing protein [Gammaproteobacteria bacterium]